MSHRSWVRAPEGVCVSLAIKIRIDDIWKILGRFLHNITFTGGTTHPHFLIILAWEPDNCIDTLAERSKAVDSSSIIFGCVGSNPTGATLDQHAQH